MAKELSPYLKEMGGYAKATDKTLDLLFDEACRESLRVHCLDRADGYTRKQQYKQVPRQAAPQHSPQHSPRAICCIQQTDSCVSCSGLPRYATHRPRSVTH